MGCPSPLPNATPFGQQRIKKAFATRNATLLTEPAKPQIYRVRVAFQQHVDGSVDIPIAVVQGNDTLILVLARDVDQLPREKQQRIRPSVDSAGTCHQSRDFKPLNPSASLKLSKAAMSVSTVFLSPRRHQRQLAGQGVKRHTLLGERVFPSPHILQHPKKLTCFTFSSKSASLWSDIICASRICSAVACGDRGQRWKC